jgi:hypothetical protein
MEIDVLESMWILKSDSLGLRERRKYVSPGKGAGGL